MLESRNLRLPYVAEAQTQKHVTVNDAFRRIDSVVQLAVVGRTHSAPPSSPSEGDRYIVGPNPTDQWDGHLLDVAVYIDGAWLFFTPTEGWITYVQEEDTFAYFSGSAWEVLRASDGVRTTPQIGINATAGETNRLSVRSASALFAPDPTSGTPGNVRIIATKDGPGDIASHLFQTSFSARAEFGLIGSDDFSLKVSPDGSQYAEAFSVDRESARVNFATMPTVGKGDLAYSLASAELLRQTTVPVGINRLETRGYSLENDGGAGEYERVASLTADGLGLADGGDGYWQLVGQTVNPRQVGATGDGVTDDTAAINVALQSKRDVFIDRGVYMVDRALRSGAPSQKIFGVGRGRTVLRVRPSFDMSSNGILEIVHPFVAVSDIEIEFDQSGAESRAALTKYPAGVHLAGQSHCRVSRLRLLSAWDGIDATGNAAGTILEDIDCGSFNEGFRIGGALGSVDLVRCRTGLFGLTGNADLIAIHGDGRNVGFRFGRIDDLRASNCRSFRTKVVFEATDRIGPSGTFAGLTLDGAKSTVEFNDGDVAIAGCSRVNGAAEDVAFLQTGGRLTLSDFDLRASASSAVAIVHVVGPNASCDIQNGICTLGAGTASEGFRISAGRLSLRGVRFVVDRDAGRSAPMIHQIGGTLEAFGNCVEAPTTGSGVFLQVATDSNHAILGNMAPGYGYTFPALRTRGLYGPNHDGSNVRFETPILISDTGGTATLTGADLRWSNGMALSRGRANEVQSVAIGELALASTTTGTVNTAVGSRALASLTSGAANVAVGTNAGSAAATATGNTFVGGNAGSTATGSNNTGLGRNTFDNSPASVQNASAIGSGATVTGSSQVQLGNSATTTYTYGAVQMRSDERDKADVRDTAFGLDFVKRLRPVDFRWNYREDYLPAHDGSDDGGWETPQPGSKKRSRYHHGFIAQEVAQVINHLGADFGGYQDHSVAGGSDVQSIGYSELLAPIVRSIQELNERLDRLESS